MGIAHRDVSKRKKQRGGGVEVRARGSPCFLPYFFLALFSPSRRTPLSERRNRLLGAAFQALESYTGPVYNFIVFSFLNRVSFWTGSF